MSDVSSSAGRSFNWRHLLGVIALVGVAAGAWWVVVNERSGDEIVGSVGESELTESDLIELLDSIEPILVDDTFPMGQARGMLQQWLIVEAIEDEMDHRGVDLPQSVIDEAGQLMIDQAGDPSTPEGQLQAKSNAISRVLTEYVEDSVEVDAEPPEWLCSSHVLLESEEKALEVLARAEDGADFATLAMDFSVGPSAPNGGDLGCVPSSQFVPDFVDGARASGGSGLVGPVETDFGFHVINVRSLGELSIEVHPELEADFVANELERAETEVLDVALSEAFSEFVNRAEERILDGGYVASQYGTWQFGAGLVAPATPIG